MATTAARRWRVTLTLLVAAVLSGVYAFAAALDREGFPPINRPVSVVTGTYFVDDADRVDTEVAAPQAAAFLGVEDVVEVSSEAQPSGFAIVVEFDDTVDSAVGTQRLQELGVIAPEGATVDYRGVNAAKFVGEYDLLVSIVGADDATPADLEAEAATLSDLLAALPAVERADVRSLLTTGSDPATG